MVRARRSQSERTAETRQRLIVAAVDRLLGHGMAGATVTEICRAAAVTTGALQHQFGSKAGLMATVVDTLFAPFQDDHEPLGASAHLEARIARLVDHHWRIYDDDRYPASLEVLLATRHDPELRAMVVNYRERQLASLAAYLEAEFPDVELEVSEMIAAVHRVIDMMRGYTVHRMFERSEALDRQLQEEARAMLMRAFVPDTGRTSMEGSKRGA